MIRENADWRDPQRNGIAPWPILVLGLALGCGGSSDSGGTNHAPAAVVNASTAVVLMGQSTDLQAQASDPDGDSLTYSWAQTSPATPQGTFSSSTSGSPTWTAPTVGETTSFTLAVTVSDGKGASDTATVTIYAKTSADPSFVAEVSRVLARACADCHGGLSPAVQLSLEASKSYVDLVNVPALVSCRGELRVTPGDPDHSVLLQKMTGAGCGARMPPSDPTYYDRAPDEVALVRAWIQNGAPRN